MIGVASRYLHCPSNFHASLISSFARRSRLFNVFYSRLSFEYQHLSTLDTLVSALIVSLSHCSSIAFSQSVHARVFKSVNYRHGFIGDQLVTCYIKLGCPEEAQKLFDEMPHKDVVSWNSLLSGFSRSGYINKCFYAFSRMRCEPSLLPNDVSCIALISVCMDEGAVSEGKSIHGFVLKSGMLWEVKVSNALINFYGKFGFFHWACWLFEAMPMQNLVSWNSMVAIYAKDGAGKEGMGYFVRMRRLGIAPDQATMVSVLQACEYLGLGKLAESVHAFMVHLCFDLFIPISTALLNLYAKLGNLNASEQIFNEMTHCDRVAWTAMLAAYAMHGRGEEAMHLLEHMVKEGLEPDHVTFTHLLSACSHSGLVEEGRNYFKIMSEVYGIQPRLDHYSCMVDLLGRSGFLNDAYELIQSMPMEPNSAVWGTLLGACRVYGNTKLGKEISQRLFTIDPSDGRNYIMLSNIYSAAGMWNEASKMRRAMKEKGLNRTPGCSFIEYENEIHRFVVGDRSHAETEKIYDKLEELIAKVRKAGFVPKTEIVLHNVDEEMKEDMISQHSEKLAIAFGLLVIHSGMPLIITKNLRICVDCHGFAKIVSLIEMRTIIIRDSKRFHHFVNGSCSCGDYW